MGFQDKKAVSGNEIPYLHLKYTYPDFPRLILLISLIHKPERNININTAASVIFQLRQAEQCILSQSKQLWRSVSKNSLQREAFQVP